jgi:hypothetical protein
MIDAASLRERFPQLKIIERTPNELEISSPARPQRRLTITLPHLDVQCEATASWANVKQVIRLKDGVGHVQEASQWHDAPDAWTVPFDEWVEEWLALLAGNGSGPARPGRTG